MPDLSLAEEVRPLAYDIRVEPDPLRKDDDRNAKVLVIALPLEMPPRALVFALNDDLKTRIHDGTAPSELIVGHPGQVPPYRDAS